METSLAGENAEECGRVRMRNQPNADAMLERKEGMHRSKPDRASLAR